MSKQDMSNESAERTSPVTGEGYVVPITGLLALLFALLAGGTAYPALTSGSVSLATLPVIFGAASLLCIRLRQRYIDAKEE